MRHLQIPDNRKLVARLALWASISLMVGCGPKPGTPEYVLQQLEEGNVVGTENLQLLTLEHLDAMLAIIDSPQVNRIAKQQLIIRATSLRPDRLLERLGGYLNHDEPDVRLHMVRWMATLEDPQTIDRLIERLLIEPEAIVRLKIADALTSSPSRARADQSAVAARLITELAGATPVRKKDLLIVLGGFPTPEAVRIIEKHLQDEDLAIAGSAGRAAIAASREHFDAVVGLLPAMIGHRHSDVRRNGLRILWSQVRQSEADACRGDLPASLLDHADSIHTALGGLTTNTAIHESERTMADQIRTCLKPAAPGESSRASDS